MGVEGQARHIGGFVSTPLIHMSAALRLFPQICSPTVASAAPRGSAKHELSLRDLRIRPSMVCLLLMLPPGPLAWLGWQRDSGWLLGLGLVLMSLIGVSLWLAAASLRGLRLRLLPPAPCFAGDTAMLELRLENPSARARWDVSVHAEGAASQGWLDIAPRASNLALVPMPTGQRGQCPLPALLITSQHPLSLFHVSARWNTGLTLLVFPRPTLPDPLTAAPKRARASTSLTPVWLDLAQTAGHGVEEQLSGLAADVLQAERLERCYGMRLGSLVVPPRRGVLHRRRCLELLSLYQQNAAPAVDAPMAGSRIAGVGC